MKKIFFILLILSITINAFPIDFKAQIFGGFNLFDYYDDEFGMGGGERGRIRLEGSVKKNDYGAWLRIDVEGLEDTTIGAFGYVFYKPIDQLEFYVTRNPDGHFKLDGNALWDFYGLPGDVIGITFDHSFTGSFEDAGFNNAFYSGFTEGAFLTYTPNKVKELAINWGVPVFENLEALDMLKSMTLQVTYDLKNVGLFGLTYSGIPKTQIDDTRPPWRDDDTGAILYIPSDPWNKSGVLRAYFGTTISDIKFDFGIGYMLPEKDGDDKRNYPINVGAAAAFDIGKVNIKSRLLFSGFGSYKYEGDSYKSPIDFIIDVLPSMPLNKNIMGYLNLSLFIHSPDEGDTQVGWSIYPYISVGNPNTFSFYTGLEIIYIEDVYFRIPIGLCMNF